MAFDFSKVNTGAVENKEVKVGTQVKEEVKETKTTSAMAKAEVKVAATPSTSKATAPVGVVMGLDKSILSLSKAEIDKKVSDIVANMEKIKEELNDTFIERENEIEMLALGLVAGVNSFFHGPAGTGKSDLVESWGQRIVNANYFRTLMGKTTEPGEIFGATSISAMKNDKYKVNTAGKLPEAHIAFVDEVFKCNSAVLNSLLTVMNEHMFFNDGIQKVPLISMVGASNEYMEEDNLAALYDRFLLRWHVDYIQDANNRMDLFKNFLARRSSKSAFQSSAALTTLSNDTKIDLQDLMLLNEKAKEVTISAKVLKEYNKIFVTLGKKGIFVSDRRKNESLKVLQASALLDGRDAVDTSDFEALRFTLWNTQDQIQTVIDEIAKVANPNATKYNQYKKVLEDYKKDLQKIEDKKDDEDYSFNKTITITETIKHLQFAMTTIQGILPTLKAGSKDFNRFTALLKDMNDYVTEIKKEIVG